MKRPEFPEDLPQIDTLPTRFSTSCVSISQPLLDLLDAILPPPPALTLSVGSGPGLLEAVFLRAFPYRARKSFYGVEVHALWSVNRFLPAANIINVPGSWGIASEARRAEALLFVYPRQPGLLRQYLGIGDKLQMVVWMGPRCDADAFLAPLKEWGIQDSELTESCNESGLEDGEMVAVFQRRARPDMTSPADKVDVSDI